MTMLDFFLVHPTERAEIPADLLDQLRAVPGIRVVRVMTGIVQVRFAGAGHSLVDRLAGTRWSGFRVSEKRTYRLQ